jgi:3,4-dihydroxyphenylacetate 2,3-dioxygenase
MGQIVAAAVVSHQPGIMLPEDVRLKIYAGRDTSLIKGLHDLRQALDDARPDTFVIFDTHWFTTLEHIVAGAPHYKGLYTSEELPVFLSDFPYDFAGAPELAWAVAEIGAQRKVPVLNYDKANMALHYPTINLVHYLRKDEKVLSIGVCQAAEEHNFLALGAVLADAIARTPGRVALLASGGMSHAFQPLDRIMERLGPDPDGVVSPEARAMDWRIIELWRRGDHAGVLALYPEFRRYQPEGFFGHYLMMVGALGGAACTARGRSLSDYENAAGTGQVHVWFDLAA